MTVEEFVTTTDVSVELETVCRDSEDLEGWETHAFIVHRLRAYGFY